MTTRQKLFQILMGIGLTITVFYSLSVYSKEREPSKYTPWRDCVVTATTPEGYCTMTAKEQKRGCDLALDALAENAEFYKRLTKVCMTKDCEFIAHFYAAQDKRRHEATSVGVFARQWQKSDYENNQQLRQNNQRFEKFLRDYPFLRNDIPSITQAGIAEVRGNVNLLFVLYPDARGRTRLQVYVDGGAGYKKATLDDETESSIESVSWANGEVSLFFSRSGGRIGPVPPSVEYMLGGGTIDKPKNMSDEEWGRTFHLTEPHEGC
jgi:hypothetical protein